VARVASVGTESRFIGRFNSTSLGANRRNLMVELPESSRTRIGRVVGGCDTPPARIVLTSMPGAERYLPARLSLPALRQAALACRGCPLYRDTTQTVFGAGRKSARLMLVGEQPGDAEDRAGRPFVGPAGRLLDTALEEAGIDPLEIYITNVVKHFKHETRGGRRFHKTPKRAEIEACRPWIDSEIAVVRPKVLVCLGATAARALLGPGVRVTVDRGRDLPTSLAPHALVTIHPSAVLRIPESADRRRELQRLTADLALAGRMLSDA
jgi:uracil-DNA glycosylase family protein